MKSLLNALLVSSKHLYVLNKVFEENYPLYEETLRKLEGLTLFDEFRQEIYVGGKKRG